MKVEASREFQERRKLLEELTARSQAQIKKLESDLRQRAGKITRADFLILSINSRQTCKDWKA